MVAMEETRFFRTDCESIWSQIKHQDKQIQLKRRWLLGLPASESKRKKSKRGNTFESRSLPESLIREDDIFYDNVKSCVEEAFGIHRRAETGLQVVPDELELPEMTDIPRVVLSCIDNLNTIGLCLLAKVLTGDRIEFEKTRWKMKKAVRESLSVVFGSRNSKKYDHPKEISRQITQLLNDPQNFQDSCAPPYLTSRPLIQRATAKKILQGLGNFPCQTLIAMHKKLKEMQQSMPQLQPQRNGWNRDYLIKQVRKNSEKMLSELGKEDQLPGPLAKAMAVASLSLKLTHGFHNSFATEFHQFSPETKVLQNEITKAIWLVKTKVGIPVLKNVKNLLDPNAKVSNRCLRTAIRKMLIEYLFGCDDMDSVPKSLFETLAMINRNSRSTPNVLTVKNAIDEEIECILHVSAHTKQNLLDLLPANDFDVDFTDAYMEDLEDSDDEFGYVDNNCDTDDEMGPNEDNISLNSSSYQEVESTGDSVPINLNPSTAANNAEETCPTTLDERSNNVHVDGPEAKACSRADNTQSSFEEPKETSGKQTTYKNKYLAIQEVCDETSMAAYSLIGRLLEEFGHKEGLDLDWYCSLYLRRDCINEEEDSQELEQSSTNESDGVIIVRLAEELKPSFPKSGIERLRKLLGS